MALPIQELLHKYQVGSGYRYLTYLLGIVAIVTVAVVYDLRCYRNLSVPEAMDAAQVGRNLSEGRGFATQLIRPLSIHLLRKRQFELQAQAAVSGGAPATATQAASLAEAARLDRHPDLANPPVYPLLLAGALKLMPFSYPRLLTASQDFRIYAPDLWIGMVNQLLFLVAVCLVFFLARRLFDPSVAWLSAAVLVASEVFWRFSLSGLPAMLLTVLFLGLLWVLAELEPATRDAAASGSRLVLLATLAGLLVGIGGLTRYGFLALLIPVIGFCASVSGPQRVRLILVATAACAAVVLPWLVRNYHLSGNPFGTAAYALHQGTPMFTGRELERMLHPDFGLVTSAQYWHKLLKNILQIVRNELPQLGGTWVSAFFLTGLFVPFRNPTLRRLRWFVVSALAVLSVVQALGPVPIPDEAADVNGRNLVIVVAPIVFVFGISLLFSLVDQFAEAATRAAVVGIFFLIGSAPFLLTLISPPPSAIAYPPYYPPYIQEKARWIEKDEWLTADLPWAVAWYGGCQSVWLPLKYADEDGPNEDFFELHQIKPLRGLYLSAHTLKSVEVRAINEWRQSESADRDWQSYQLLTKGLLDFLSSTNEGKAHVAGLRDMFRLAQKHWITGGGETWDAFILGVFINQEVPTGFPLGSAPEGLWPEVFLTDSERGARKTIQSSEAVQEQ